MEDRSSELSMLLRLLFLLRIEGERKAEFGSPLTRKMEGLSSESRSRCFGAKRSNRSRRSYVSLRSYSSLRGSRVVTSLGSRGDSSIGTIRADGARRRSWISLTHRVRTAESSPCGRNNSVCSPWFFSFAGSAGSLLLRRKARELDEGGSERRLITSVVTASDFFLLVQMSPI